MVQLIAAGPGLNLTGDTRLVRPLLMKLAGEFGDAEVEAAAVGAAAVSEICPCQSACTFLRPSHMWLRRAYKEQTFQQKICCGACSTRWALQPIQDVELQMDWDLCQQQTYQPLLVSACCKPAPSSAASKEEPQSP